jgi:hypothetical protein
MAPILTQSAEVIVSIAFGILMTLLALAAMYQAARQHIAARRDRDEAGDPIGSRESKWNPLQC